MVRSGQLFNQTFTRQAFSINLARILIADFGLHWAEVRPSFLVVRASVMPASEIVH